MKKNVTLLVISLIVAATVSGLFHLKQYRNAAVSFSSEVHIETLAICQGAFYQYKSIIKCFKYTVKNLRNDVYNSKPSFYLFVFLNPVTCELISEFNVWSKGTFT